MNLSAVPRLLGVLLHRTQRRFIRRLLSSPTQRRHALEWVRSTAPGYLMDAPSPWIVFDAIDYIKSRLGRVHAAGKMYKGKDRLYAREENGMGAVTIEKAGAVATLRMNRPERMNAYDFEMGKALLSSLGALSVDPDIRCIVFTGSARVFSAGGDIVMMSGMKGDTASRFLELTVLLHAFISSLRRCRKPVISAVNGVAAGAGLPLALA